LVLGTYDFNQKKFTALTFPVDVTKANAVQINARLGAASGTLPLAFGALVGMTAYDTTRTSIATLGGPISAKPTLPVAIDRNIFNGKTKGFTAPDDVIVSTKLNNMAFTGFF